MGFGKHPGPTRLRRPVNTTSRPSTTFFGPALFLRPDLKRSQITSHPYYRPFRNNSPSTPGKSFSGKTKEENPPPLSPAVRNGSSGPTFFSPSIPTPYPVNCQLKKKKISAIVMPRSLFPFHALQKFTCAAFLKLTPNSPSTLFSAVWFVNEFEFHPYLTVEGLNFGPHGA